MREQQAIIVPKISSFPAHEARSRAMLRWLVQQNIVEAQVSTCGRSSNKMANGIAAGARRIVEHPELLPFNQPINGLELVYERCIFTPLEDFQEEAGCPECRQEIGAALFDSLEEWMPGHSDNFSCPECGHEDDLNGFLFLEPCGFSNLGFIFNNWAEAVFKQSFLDEFAERLGYPIALVRVDL
ncbi:MAG: sugar ABC transporter ATPase [Pseudomonas sp.]